MLHNNKVRKIREANFTFWTFKNTYVRLTQSLMTYWDFFKRFTERFRVAGTPKIRINLVLTPKKNNSLTRVKTNVNK